MNCSESGVKVARKEDRRVQRTRQLLRGALFSLIQERGFEALTVQDIIDRANVGRATFYAHFDNKEDLLLVGFDELRASLKERQREALTRGNDQRLFAFSHEIFLHTNEHRGLFRAMVGKQSGAVIQQVLHKMMVDLVREDVKATVPPGDADSIPMEALVQFVGAGLFGLLMSWLEGKVRMRADEVSTLFRRLAIPAVKAAVAAKSGG